MKTQRTLATLWLTVFIATPCYWLWEFLERSAPAYDGLHAWFSLIFLFGAVACISLFRGEAKWACIAIGIIALFLAVGGLWDLWERGWMWRDKWADNAVCFLALTSVVLLFFPKTYLKNRNLNRHTT